MAQPTFDASELIRLFGQVPAVVWACDRDLRFTFGAGAALTPLGLQPNELVGVTLSDYFGVAPQAPDVISLVRRALAGEHVVHEIEWQGVILESHISPLRDANGEIAGAIGLALDITERRKMEEELLLHRRHLEMTSALLPVAHYSIDESGTLQLTPEHRRMFGLPESSSTVTYDDLLARVHPDDRQHVVDVRALSLAKREPYSFRCRVIRADGSVRHLRFQASHVFDRQGRPIRTIGTVSDETEDVERLREIAELLTHDGLTGLPNRSYFTDRLRHDFAVAHASSEVMAVAIVDLDRFSRVNDSLGHLAGDAYLRTIASRLRTFQEGTQDVVARIGGDEFALLVRGTRRPDVVRRLDSLRRALEMPVVIDGEPLRISVSMGVAIYPHDAIDQTILQKADLALSNARSSASGHTEYYDSMLAQDVASSLRLERALHEAVRGSSILPYYQPVVDRLGRIKAVEALARWNHPQLGLLTPSAFLEVAEESGLIVDIGERMLRQSFSDIVALRERLPSLRLNLNLSPRQLLSRRLPELIRHSLEEHALPPEALQLEVTEQSLIIDFAEGRNAIELLRALGASVVIDDFGTGYNTLTYLKSYKVDGIKLDRVFVKDMLTDRHSRAICEGVAVMARTLDLHVIAEGIESVAQSDAAISMGCAELQGFLFGEPLPLRGMASLLRA